MRPWAALWGLAIATVDIALLDTIQTSLRHKAAKIQESFDCSVLDLRWNAVVAGSRPDPETIVEAGKDYRPDPKRPLENWYPRDAGKLPLPAGRLICQRTNLVWDSVLRRRCGWVLLGVISVVAVGTVVTAIARHLTLEAFLLTFWVPLSPAYLWTVREFRKHRAAADSSERLRGFVEDLWSRVLNGNILDADLIQESRRLQDEIYRRRRDVVPVFDFIYNRLRSKHEEQANRAAEALVKEALAQGLDKTT
jgi:hypothetical protein